MKNFLIAVSLITFISTAFGQREKELSKNGIHYQYHSFGTGKKAELEDIITYHYQVYDYRDSLLDDTRSKDPISAMVRTPLKKGSLEEMLFYFTEGDKLTVKIKADSLFPKGRMPSIFKAGTDLRWEIDVLKIQTQAQFEETQQAAAEKLKQDQRDEIVKYLESKEFPVQETETGLFYHVTDTSNGKQVQSGDLIKVHYTGKLMDGTVFDSSIPRGQPLQFTVGQKMVIPGWDEGLMYLKEGEKAELCIPAHLAYGPKGAGTIPPNSILIFDVEVVEIYDPERQKVKDDEIILNYLKENKIKVKKNNKLPSGLYFFVTEKSKGELPVKGQKVAVHYTGRLLDSTKFDSSVDRGTPFEFTIGEGQVIEGWDEGIALMKTGSKGLLLIPSHLAYGLRGAGRSIAPNTVLLFEVELIEIKE